MRSINVMAIFYTVVIYGNVIAVISEYAEWKSFNPTIIIYEFIFLNVLHIDLDEYYQHKESRTWTKYFIASYTLHT